MSWIHRRCEAVQHPLACTTTLVPSPIRLNDPMAKLKLDLHDVYNCGNAIDRERVIHEAVDKRIKEVEIIPGRGSG